MIFEDKSVQCSDSGSTFAFTAGEQKFYQSKASRASLSVIPHVAEPTKQEVLTVTSATPVPNGKILQLWNKY
ncbi:MAG: zinc-ribbon domain containing protein [Dehalococcoidales bacterium]|jgi:hypothetical protein